MLYEYNYIIETNHVSIIILFDTSLESGSVSMVTSEGMVPLSLTHFRSRIIEIRFFEKEFCILKIITYQ
jgi:hypothetical protein